eukprot:1150402-Pelagomonas_calceolata.AAC.2
MEDRLLLRWPAARLPPVCGDTQDGQARQTDGGEPPGGAAALACTAATCVKYLIACGAPHSLHSFGLCQPFLYLPARMTRTMASVQRLKGLQSTCSLPTSKDDKDHSIRAATKGPAVYMLSTYQQG